MSDGGRVERTAAPAERRPAAPTVVQRTAASIARSPAQAVQDRLGYRASQLLIARSTALSQRDVSTRVGATAPHGAQTSKSRRLPISSPRDPAELEAEAVARRVVNMPAPPVAAPPPPVGPVPGAAGGAQRSHHKSSETPPSRSASPIENTGAGSPLPASVRANMEPRFGASFDAVRVHTGDAAAQHSSSLDAHAFTVGQHIYFGRDKFQPHSAGGQELIAHELTHTIQQGAASQRGAVHRSAATVSQQSPPSVQRAFLGIPNPREYFAGKAANIPGYTMLTVVIGYNPILGRGVERTAGNILRGAIEMIPGGKFITDALNAHGVFDTVSTWAAKQFETLKDVGARLKQDIDDFIKNVSLTDLGGAWDQGKALVMRPIDRVIAFAISLKDGIVTLIKDAILKPIAAFARTTSGYPLLCTILGKDPITGEPAAQDAESLLGGFLKFIGEEETWNTIQQAKAIPRTIAWFKGAISALTGFLKEVPGLFIAAFKALSVEDIILIPRAFGKLAGVFGNFAVRFVTWGANAVWELLQIIFDVVAPGALAYIKKTGAALKSILKNPLPFMGNLVKAAKLGFTNFGAHFLDHLKAGLIDWLTGSLPGIYIPKAFSLVEIAKFAFSVLGLTWANIRQKLVKATSETVVKAMETGFDIVVTLVRDGPAAAWDKIKDQLSNLKDMVIGGITDFVVDMVVKKAIPKLIAMFIPGAGFISAILTIYDTIMVFVNKIKQIIQVVKGFIDSIVAIAAGQIGAAADRVEGALAGVLSLAINFLAGFAGLGKVADKVMGVIQKIRAPIDKALDWLVNFIVTGAKKLGKFIVQAGVPEDPNERVRLGADAAVAVVNALRGPSVTAALINPALAAIKLRYGLKTLVPVDVSGEWWVDAEVNPRTRKKTTKLSAAVAGTAGPGPAGRKGQLKIASIKVTDPTTVTKLELARATSGRAWQDAINAAVVKEVLAPKWEIVLKVPIEILVRGQKAYQYPSRTDLARMKIERGHRAGRAGVEPDVTMEVREPTGGGTKEVRIVEVTLVEDFTATGDFAKHKIEQFTSDVMIMKEKYGPDMPVKYFYAAPREPTPETKTFILDTLRTQGAKRFTVVWLVVRT